MENNTVINDGGIDGNLEGFGPFFCLVRSGGMSADLKCKEKNKDGIFSFSNHTSYGYLYQTGLVLPISSIEDRLRNKFQKMISWIKTLPIQNDMKLSRKMLKKYLEENNLDFLKINSGSNLDGWIQLELDKNIFENFVQNLSYVSQVGIDNDVATILETKKFRWKSYGELIEWFYGFTKKNSFDRIELFSFYLVINHADGAGYSLERKTSMLPSYEYPRIDFTTLFDLKKEIKDSSLEVFIEETEHGWALLRMTIDKVVYPILLSSVFDPLEPILYFVNAVECNDLPAIISIDEEGTDKKIEGYAISEVDRFVFVLSDPFDDDDNLIAQVVFNRKYFVEVMISAFKDFFENRYIQTQWDYQLEEGELSTKEKILNNKWFCSKLG